ncbi:MAG TPA: BON domain-containing protein [Usitatibacter sp.]|nr:BON domain-containing protein [Usitatibacter sp.]
MNANRLMARLFITIATFGLAACDRPSTAARDDAKTVGQKLDNALDRTQQKLAEAGDKTAQKLAEAGDKTVQTVSHAGEKTQQALSSAGEKIAAKTSDAMSSVASSVSPSPDTSRAVSDAAITASIKTDFLKDPDLSVLKIDVDTKAGVVTLNGLAGDEPARQRAEKMAISVKGVREVRNFLVVKRA